MFSMGYFINAALENPFTCPKRGPQSPHIPCGRFTKNNDDCLACIANLLLGFLMRFHRRMVDISLSLSLKEVHLNQYDLRPSNRNTEGQSLLHEINRILLCGLRIADCSEPQKAHTHYDGKTPRLPRIFPLPPIVETGKLMQEW